MRAEKIWSGAAALLVLVAVGLLLLRARPPAQPGLDLVELFPEAEKRSTLPGLHVAFALLDVTIDGETRPAILAHADSRIIWRLDVPERALLEVFAAMRPDTWTAHGDGVIFRIGVSTGAEYQELFKQRLSPYEFDSDRRWVPVAVDLSPYAGQRVEIIFNTDSGIIGNNANDAAVWGAPRIVRAS